MTSQLVDLPWGQVHVRRAGTQGVPLMLVHQSPLSSRTYAPALPPLAAAGFLAVAPDTPGFGSSTATPRSWCVADYAAALWQLVDRLGLGRVALLGQHTGATIGVEAALQRPDRVRGLVLQGLPLYEGGEGAERLATYAPPYEPSLDGSHLAFVWERVRRMYPRLDARQATDRLVEYLEAGPDYATAYRAVFRYDMAARLPLVRVPVHLVYGEHDLVAWRQSRVHALIDGVVEEVLDGLTDFAALEAPGRFAAAVARHLL